MKEIFIILHLSIYCKRSLSLLRKKEYFFHHELYLTAFTLLVVHQPMTKYRGWEGALSAELNWLL